MKSTINKTQLMKRAWSIFRGTSQYSWSFADSLRRAWFVEKETVAYNKREAERLAESKRIAEYRKNRTFTSIESDPAYNAALVAWYNNPNANNTYFGD